MLGLGLFLEPEKLTMNVIYLKDRQIIALSCSDQDLAGVVSTGESFAPSRIRISDLVSVLKVILPSLN
jgi:hypothetical protein